MNRESLQEALTGMGVSFPKNAKPEKLQALYDEALAAKAAGGEISKDTPPDAPAPEGNPGPAPDAAPAADPAPAAAAPAKTFSEELDDEILEIEILSKMKAGLKREQAFEVIRNQRAHDKSLASAGETKTVRR